MGLETPRCQNEQNQWVGHKTQRFWGGKGPVLQLPRVSPLLGFQRWPVLLRRSPEGIFCSRLGGGHRHMQRGQPRGHVLTPVRGFSLASAEAAGAGSGLRVGADLGVCRQRGTAGPRVPGRAGDTSLPARCHRGAAEALVAGCRPAALTTGSLGPSPRQRGEARGGLRCTRTCCLIAGDWQLLVTSPPGRDVGGR